MMIIWYVMFAIQWSHDMLFAIQWSHDVMFVIQWSHDMLCLVCYHVIASCYVCYPVITSCCLPSSDYIMLYLPSSDYIRLCLLLCDHIMLCLLFCDHIMLFAIMWSHHVLFTILWSHHVVCYPVIHGCGSFEHRTWTKTVWHLAWSKNIPEISVFNHNGVTYLGPWFSPSCPCLSSGWLSLRASCDGQSLLALCWRGQWRPTHLTLSHPRHGFLSHTTLSTYLTQHISHYVYHQLLACMFILVKHVIK